MPGWIAPSLDNKVERHLDIISRYLSVMPVKDVFIKAATYDTQLLAALEAGEPVPQGKDYQHGHSTDTIHCGKRSLNGTTIPVCIAREV